MRQLSTSDMRKHISEVIDDARYRGQVFVVGRHNRPEIIIMKFPENLNKSLNETTNFNSNSPSFEFLKDEPDIYSTDDLKIRYV